MTKLAPTISCAPPSWAAREVGAENAPRRVRKPAAISARPSSLVRVPESRQRFAVRALTQLLEGAIADLTDALARNPEERADLLERALLAIIETVLPATVGPSPGYLMDLNMMVMTGGRERSETEFAALLDRTGFRLESVTPLPIPMSVVQAVAA